MIVSVNSPTLRQTAQNMFVIEESAKADKMKNEK